jgi:hypothetical protein
MAELPVAGEGVGNLPGGPGAGAPVTVGKAAVQMLPLPVFAAYVPFKRLPMRLIRACIA